MKILLVGEFLPTRIEVSYTRAFNQLSCKVKVFDTGQANRLNKFFWEYAINKNLLKCLDSFRPNLIFVFKGYFLFPKTITRIKESYKCPIFCFNTDDPFNLSASGSSNNNILASIPHYDYYFSFSRRLLDPIQKSGAKNVGYLPFGFDPELHYPEKPSPAEKALYANDIVFIGNWDREREKWLNALGEFELGIWGEEYWSSRCGSKKLRLQWHGKAAYGKELSKVLNSCAISLNILRLQNKGSHNMRSFEAPACRAFVLSELSDELLDFFTEDKETVYFSSLQEMQEKAKYYLSHPEKRDRIAQAGYQRCISSGYSYYNRAKNILALYEKQFL